MYTNSANVDGHEGPLSSGSDKLTPTQQEWSTNEREAYVVIWTLKRFECLIFCASVNTIFDDNPLKYIVDCTS